MILRVKLIAVSLKRPKHIELKQIDLNIRLFMKHHKEAIKDLEVIAALIV